AALGRARNDHRAVLLLDLHARRHLLAELAERAVDHHAAGRDRHGHAGRKLNGLSTDSAHRSPDEAEDLAADTLLLGGAARDQAVGRGQDRGAHAAEDARQAVLARVDAAAGLGDALQIRDHPLSVLAELELDRKRVVRQLLLALDVEVADVSLLLEQAGAAPPPAPPRPPP